MDIKKVINNRFVKVICMLIGIALVVGTVKIKHHKLEWAMFKCSLFRGDSCTVDFQNDLPFKWDSLYYFHRCSSTKKIDSITGIDVTKVWGRSYDSCLLDCIIFKNNGELSYAQNWFYNYEDIYNTVVFENGDKDFTLSRAEAVFTLRHFRKAFILTNAIITPSEVLERDWQIIRNEKGPYIQDLRFD